MTVKKQRRTAKEKATIAIEAISGKLTSSEICSRYGVTSGQICVWKKQLLSGAVDIFSSSPDKRDKEGTQLIEELYKQIGQLSVERDWLKKKAEVFEL
jgi:transposase